MQSALGPPVNFCWHCCSESFSLTQFSFFTSSFELAGAKTSQSTDSVLMQSVFVGSSLFVHLQQVALAIEGDRRKRLNAIPAKIEMTDQSERVENKVHISFPAAFAGIIRVHLSFEIVASTGFVFVIAVVILENFAWIFCCFCYFL